MTTVRINAPESTRLKLRRATEHFNLLKGKVEEFFNANPNESIFDFKADLKDMVVRVRVIKPPPIEWGVIIGDVLHNLRSALDNLISITILKHKGSIERSEFPIFLKPDLYSERTKKGIPTTRSGLIKVEGLPIPAQAVIEDLQPYKGTDGPPDLHPLWLLHELSNSDKHRMVDMVQASMSSGWVEISGLGYRRGEGRFTLPVGALEDGAIVVHLRRMFGRPIEPNVEVKFHFTPGIAFSPEGPGRGLPILDTLAGINNFISQKVLPPFSPFVK